MNKYFYSEFGAISPELNSVYQAGFMGFLIGAIYGGVIQSREGYLSFMENNEATAFKSHLDAKVGCNAQKAVVKLNLNFIEKTAR